MGMFSRNTPAVSLIKMILIPFFCGQSTTTGNSLFANIS